MSRAYERAFPVPGGAEIRGLTIREHFAAMAMQGLLSTLGNVDFNRVEVARHAALVADSLLAELAKERP